MLKRFTYIFGIGVVLLALVGCHNKHVKNPIAQVDSKQPDKVLFDRAMEAMKSNKFDVSRLTLQTLINTYPDSEFVARAKLAIGDSWYAEGSSTALMQAENEYKDFITFFPNMPEAAEAQLKIANIHYKQMEKPDRDYTHAKRAEEEYRYLITTFPDSKLVPDARKRLLEVQEVLGEREFRIGKFYYTRESWVAAEARLQSLVDTYPLYSGADEALFLLGSAYQRQADLVRASPGIPEAAKGKMINTIENKAANAYNRILTRYPVMPRAEDAKRVLAEMHRKAATPTAAAIAQNKAEQESRGETGMWASVMSNLHKSPDVNRASKVGDPVLVDPTQASAPDMLRKTAKEMAEAMGQGSAGNNKVSVQTVGSNAAAPPPNEAPPRSDGGSPESNDGIPELQPITDNSESNNAESATPPTQLNEVQKQSETPANDAAASSSSSTSGTNANASTQQAQPDPGTYSTSQKKKKKGLRKIVPF